MTYPARESVGNVHFFPLFILFCISKSHFSCKKTTFEVGVLWPQCLIPMILEFDALALIVILRLFWPLVLRID